MQVCDCEDESGNTGEALCKTLLSAAAGYILTSYRTSTGAINGIPVSATLNQSYLTGKLNNADNLLRWKPIQNLKDIEDVRSETSYKEYKDGSKYPVRDGTRAVKAVKPEGTIALLRAYKTFHCTEIGIFAIGKNGELHGNVVRDANGVPTALNPFLISSGTWNPQLTKPTDDGLQEIVLMFELAQTERDEDIGQINASEFDNVNLLLANGLLDVFSTPSAFTATGFTLKLFGNAGTAINPNKIKNLVVGDFAVANLTTPGAIAITGSGASFTESPDGTYVVEYATADQPSIGDIIEVTITKNGYDFTAVTANTFITA